MTYTLKLDWHQLRIDAVRGALEEWLAGYPVPAGMTDYPPNSPEWEVRAALADIDLYRATTEEVKASLTTDTTGYCAGCGEYIRLVDGKWLDNTSSQRADWCPAYTHGQHVKYVKRERGGLTYA